MEEERYWEYSRSAAKDPAAVVDTGVVYSGDFWTDVLAVTEVNRAPLHPCFKAAPKKPTVTQPVKDASISQSKHLSTSHPAVPVEEEPRRLSNFYLHSQRIDPFNLKILEFVIAHHETLRSLKFDNCSLDPRCLHQLTDLCEKALVSSLSLDWNSGLPGSAYTSLFKPESKLKRLTLRSCGLDDEALGVIGGMLVGNANLTVLDLYGNYFGSLEPLAKALAVNRVLEHVNVAKTGISHEQVECLVGVLGKHPFPAEKVDEHRKLEKERDAIKAKNAKSKKNPEPVPFVDEIEPIPDSPTWLVVKNNALMSLNLSMNRITNVSAVEKIMEVTKPEFLVFLALNEGMGEEDKGRLQMAYGDRLYL